MTIMASKFCPTCGKKIPYRPKDGKKGWERRKYCSKECRQYVAPPSRTLPSAIVLCIRCGNQCKRGYKEARRAHAKRKYCSNKCAHADRMRAIYRARAEQARRAVIRAVVPAATEAEWLRLNNGPTVCPPMHAAPIYHYTHIGISRRDGRAR